MVVGQDTQGAKATDDVVGIRLPPWSDGGAFRERKLRTDVYSETNRCGRTPGHSGSETLFTLTTVPTSVYSGSNTNDDVVYNMYLESDYRTCTAAKTRQAVDKVPSSNAWNMLGIDVYTHRRS